MNRVVKGLGMTRNNKSSNVKKIDAEKCFFIILIPCDEKMKNKKADKMARYDALEKLAMLETSIVEAANKKKRFFVLMNSKNDNGITILT